jgi:chemotaxis protein CheY-P-specific phosphatase CheC
MPDLTTMMKTSISEVFETAFFETVEIQPAGQDGFMAAFGDQVLTGAVLRFTKGLEGAVYVIAPDRWVSRMTADFLGIDPEHVTEDQKADTIKEATNMMAGHMFSQFDRDARIQLGIPELIQPSPLLLPDIERIRETMVWVTTDTDKLAVAIILESTEESLKS